MQKYEVTIYIEGSWTIEVEAENEDDAKQIADEKFNDNEVDYEIVDINVEELDAEKDDDDTDGTGRLGQD